MEGTPETPEGDVARPVEGDPLPPPPGEGPAGPVPPPRRRAPAPYATIGLILANGLVHLLVAWHAGVSPAYSSAFSIGRGSPEAYSAWIGALEVLGWKDNSLILSGEYWRLITAAFLHGGILHLCCNMIGLWSLGHLVEMVYGWRRFLFLYVGSAVAGSVGSMLGTQTPSVGASGAIFGLLGVGLVFSARYRKQIPKGLGAYLFKQLLFWAALLLGIGFMVRVLDNSGHIGGLVGGIVLALLVTSRVAPPRGDAFDTIEAWLAATGLVASVIVLGIGAFFLARNLAEARLRNPESGENFSLKRYDSLAGYSLRVPVDWNRTEAGEGRDQFRDEEERVPMIVRITEGGEEIRSRSPEEFRRYLEETAGGEPVSLPERIQHEVGQGYRVRLNVKKGARIKETRYYFEHGKMARVLIFDDALVSPELREVIVGSLRWRGR